MTGSTLAALRAGRSENPANSVNVYRCANLPRRTGGLPALPHPLTSTVMNAPLLDRTALTKLAELARNMPEPISLVLQRREGEGELQARLAAVAQQIHEATSGVVGVLEDSSEESPNVPALTIRMSNRDIVHYLAVPEGPEEAPFLETLATLAGSTDEDVVGTELDGLANPIEIVVFVAPGCPNCPHGVRAANALAVASSRVTVSVVDIGEFAELAKRFNVQSVPTTVVDGGLTLVGVKNQQELVRQLVELQGPGAEEAVFVSLMKSGRLADATDRLLDGRGILPFAKLWKESTLENRIALSLVGQNAIDEDPGSLDSLVHHILPSLETDDAARRGDTADLLGTIGHPSSRSALEKLLDDSHPDVAEAAADALTSIDERAAEADGDSHES